jgi:hypothetical protein
MSWSIVPIGIRSAKVNYNDGCVQDHAVIEAMQARRLVCKRI